ncbi:TetR family transcriptional regulator [Alkalibaculum sp. M08DMB]|uniref:TetR family transcriptional regulator n=1 Tax=Alkalibaculum sporogenes TaxID=2655001 RepID=A0A6A7KC90_9FIRM|nr:TetR/AcrR family transcriptional regulator [Alkalibaculum sporogenes]MPW27159.1 TetR family transcriptional regulator [Alkalibaculum sporogenes]
MGVAKFKKGLETRMRILHTAKKLFYDKGYHDTTVKEICDIADVKTGTFAYYFKTKDLLINAVYEDLLLKGNSFVAEKINRKINSVEKNTIVTFIYYMTIFKDERTISFHREVIGFESSADYLQKNLTRMYQQILKDFKLNIDEIELDYIVTSEHGLRRELISKFIDNPKAKSIIDIIIYMLLFRARLFKIDENLMRAYLFNSNEFIRKNDFSSINLL